MSTEGWTADDFKEYKEDQHKKREQRRASNTDLVSEICQELGVAIEKLADHHLRLTKPNYQPVDFFPITCKVNVLRSNQYKRVGNIENYLKEYFA